MLQTASRHSRMTDKLWIGATPQLVHLVAGDVNKLELNTATVECGTESPTCGYHSAELRCMFGVNLNQFTLVTAD